MDSSPSPFDFWYAVNNTEVVLKPVQALETFGTTTLHYHLVAELMDSVNQVRVREGTIHAYRPDIITPTAMAESMLEGFTNDQAGQYLDWLRRHQDNLLILQYGFRLKNEASSDTVISDSMDAVMDRIQEDLAARQPPMTALVRGVDEPWEVCLIKLLIDMVQQSALANAQDLRADPQGHRHEVEQAFQRASSGAISFDDLAGLLKKHQLYREYEDRFFALVRSRMT